MILYFSAKNCQDVEFENVTEEVYLISDLEGQTPPTHPIQRLKPV